MHTQPPASWPQRVRRGLPFPPGAGADDFDVIIDRDGRTFHVNRSSGEVYAQAGERWDAPPWHELPSIVRESICRIVDSYG